MISINTACTSTFTPLKLSLHYQGNEVKNTISKRTKCQNYSQEVCVSVDYFELSFFLCFWFKGSWMSMSRTLESWKRSINKVCTLKSVSQFNRIILAAILAGLESLCNRRRSTSFFSKLLIFNLSYSSSVVTILDYFQFTNTLLFSYYFKFPSIWR